MDKKVMELDRKVMGIIVNEMSIFAWCNGVVIVVWVLCCSCNNYCNCNVVGILVGFGVVLFTVVWL
jgi:hypothetical protein